MAAFTGKVPSLKPKVEAPVAAPLPTLEDKPSTPPVPKINPTSGFKLPSREEMLAREVATLKEKVEKLELKIQLDAPYYEGIEKNDKTYISKLQSIVNSQKDIIHSLTIQNNELRRDIGKLANVNS